MPAGEVTCRIRQVVRSAHVAGHHGELPRQVVTSADRFANPSGSGGAGHVIDVDHYLRQPRLLLLFRRRRLEVGVFPCAELQADGDAFDGVAGRPASVPRQPLDSKRLRSASSKRGCSLERVALGVLPAAD